MDACESVEKVRRAREGKPLWMHVRVWRRRGGLGRGNLWESGTLPPRRPFVPRAFLKAGFRMWNSKALSISAFVGPRCLCSSSQLPFVSPLFTFTLGIIIIMMSDTYHSCHTPPPSLPLPQPSPHLHQLHDSEIFYVFIELQAVRREVLEEAGVQVGPVLLQGSQAWPIGRCAWM